MLVSYVGVEEKGITAKWNVKMYVYNRKKKAHIVLKYARGMSVNRFEKNSGNSDVTFEL